MESVVLPEETKTLITKTVQSLSLFKHLALTWPKRLLHHHLKLVMCASPHSTSPSWAFRAGAVFQTNTCSGASKDFKGVISLNHVRIDFLCRAV